MTDQSYAGDVSPSDAWQILQDEEAAALVDCRTGAEWRYVGLPDLSGLGKETHCVPWQNYPDLEHNQEFVGEIGARGLGPDQTILFLCRSGVRSRHAAIAMTAVGFGRCFNVADGFEGPHDRQGHRGSIAGWKASGLPWRQD